MEEGYYEINQMRKNYPVKVVPHEYIVKDGSYVAQHWHRSVELVLAKGDGFKLWVNGITRPMCDNDLAVINHGEFHSFMAFQGENQTGCSILISYTFLKELNRGIDTAWFVINGDEDSDNRLRGVMMKIREIYRKEGEWYNLMIRSCAYELIYLLFTKYMMDKNNSHIKSMKSGEIYKEIVSYIDKHYKENIKLGDVAGYFGYHPDYFSKSFKNYIGEGFTAHLRKVRLYHARKQLLFTDKSILEIAMDTGFSDSKALIRDFKAFFQTTPLQYRKENRATARNFIKNIGN